MPVINTPIANDTDFRAAISAIYQYSSRDTPLAAQYNLVLIGDSRLADNAQGTYTWAGLLNRTDIVSQAVSGERASDFISNSASRINAIAATGARKVLIQYGKNDIDAGADASTVASRLAQIVQLIRAGIPNVKVCVLGILPVTSTNVDASRINPIIDQTGTTISTAVEASNVGGHWYQGYAGMKDSNNALVGSYSTDSSHLNATGRNLYKDSITAAEALLNASN